MSLDYNKLKSEIAVDTQIESSATTATAVSWLDMRSADSVLYDIANTDGNAGITALTMAVAVTSTGGTSATLKTIDLTDRNPDAAGDYILEEVGAQEIAQKAAEDGAEYRYLAPTMTCDGTTGVFAVTSIKDVQFKNDDINSDVIA